MMRLHRMIIIVILLLLLPLPLHSASYRSATLGDIHISLLVGDVQIRTEEASDWVPASINMPLREGDRIWAPGDGRLEIELRDGTFVRLDGNSALEILTTQKDSFQFYLSVGHAYVNFRGPRGGLLQIDTPIASMRVYESATFRVDVPDDGSTDVAVFKGVVSAESGSGRTDVDAGKSLSLKDNGYAELSPVGPPDEWERWNSERDTRTYSRYSSRYLPEELRPYSYSFDNYGKWAYARDYGYVWTPAISVSVGWSPYRTGRWVWIGGDYVWISYEPWGWVPHHYGRWVHIASRGWCWIPPARGAVYWAPGYVGWVYTPQYVAWVPLAPADVYYGYGYYGPHSVNVVNININKIAVTKVYKNVYVNDAVTVVHRDTFVAGKSLSSVAVRENPFLRERISIGSPRIRPERTSFIPVIKEIPDSKQPPQRVREIRTEELKHRRPLVKERSASVLAPQAPQKTLPLRIYDQPKGAESRKYIEKDSIPRRQVQSPERPQKKGDVVPKAQGEQGKRPIERQPGRAVQPVDKRPVPLEKRVEPLERPQKKGDVVPKAQGEQGKRPIERQPGRAIQPVENQPVPPQRRAEPIERPQKKGDSAPADQKQTHPESGGKQRDKGGEQKEGAQKPVERVR